VMLALQIAVQLGKRSFALLLCSLASLVPMLLLSRVPAPLLNGVGHPAIGVAYCAITILAMLSGLPIAFALGIVAIAFTLVIMPRKSADTIAQNVYEELANVTIIAIPLFILKGAVIGRSDAGRDLYAALHAWRHRVPGRLGVANAVACGLFSA